MSGSMKIRLQGRGGACRCRQEDVTRSGEVMLHRKKRKGPTLFGKRVRTLQSLTNGYGTLLAGMECEVCGYSRVGFRLRADNGFEIDGVPREALEVIEGKTRDE